MTAVQFEKLRAPHTLTCALTLVYPRISPMLPHGQISRTGETAFALLIRDCVKISLFSALYFVNTFHAFIKPE